MGKGRWKERQLWSAAGPVGYRRSGRLMWCHNTWQRGKEHTDGLKLIRRHGHSVPTVIMYHFCEKQNQDDYCKTNWGRKWRVKLEGWRLAVILKIHSCCVFPVQRTVRTIKPPQWGSLQRTRKTIICLSLFYVFRSEHLRTLSLSLGMDIFMLWKEFQL